MFRWQVHAYSGHLGDPADFPHRHEDTPIATLAEAAVRVPGRAAHVERTLRRRRRPRTTRRRRHDPGRGRGTHRRVPPRGPVAVGHSGRHPGRAAQGSSRRLPGRLRRCGSPGRPPARPPLRPRRRGRDRRTRSDGLLVRRRCCAGPDPKGRRAGVGTSGSSTRTSTPCCWCPFDRCATCRSDTSSERSSRRASRRLASTCAASGTFRG